MSKVRKTFKILGVDRRDATPDKFDHVYEKMYKGYYQIGYGTFYPAGGNVQVYMEENGFSAWQFHSIAEVMQLEGVMGIMWEEPNPLLEKNDELT